MIELSEELAIELRTLRKGRGLYVGQISERVGPALREICEVAADDRPGDVRRKVAERLESFARTLPEDLRVAVLAAFAIHAEARQPFYRDRVKWVAQYLRRDERTARRRVDEGTGRLIEVAVTAVAGAGAAPPDRSTAWHVQELQTVLVLDQPAPEAIERRRIVADCDGLDELDLALTVPRDPTNPTAPSPDLNVDVFYGGRLVRKVKESTDRFGFALVLPRPLGQHESHEFAMRFRIPHGQQMRPHYVCLSRHRCDYFGLRVRFDPQRPPEEIWKLTDAFQLDVDDPIVRGEPVSMDGAGEIHVEFRHLTPGLAYGARWKPS